MKIHFEQSGGFVPLQRPPVNINTDNLPPDEAKIWHDLVADADFFNLPATMTSPTARDSFSYVVQVESDNKQHAIRTQSGGAMPEKLEPLIERLRLRGQHNRA